MRLIDADVLIEAIKNMSQRYCDCKDCDGRGQIIRVSEVIDIAKYEVPTAYDIDKVVEELEELADENYKAYCIAFNSDDRAEYDAYTNAIEIVKQGGTGTETETIRDKAVKWNNNSSKRVPYEFIDYVEGKREIGVSDDVCEWKLEDEEANLYLTGCQQRQLIFDGTPKENGYGYCPYCGKKIKVVE